MTRRADLVRQLAVVVAVVLMIIAAMVGTGLLGGTNVRDLQDGALDADATYLAPGRPAFGIWSVIYVLYVLYALWQALPGQRARPRQRYAGWWIAATALLNGLWLLLAQFAGLGATVAAILALLLVLGLTLRVVTVHRGSGVADHLLIDAGVGLHLGWVAVASLANLAAWATVRLPADSWVIGSGVALLTVGLVAGAGVALGWGTGRFAPGLAMAWGLVWIGIARATGEPGSVPVSVAAWIAASIVIAVPIVRRVRDARSAAPAEAVG